MPPRPQCNVYFIASNTLDHTITLSIRGVQYEYFFRNPTNVETVHQLCRKGLGRRALNYAKAKAYSVLRHPATAAASTLSTTIST